MSNDSSSNKKISNNYEILLPSYVCPKNSRVEQGDLSPDTQFATGLFYGCNGFTVLTLPNTVLEIPSYCFASCQNLKKVVTGENEADVQKSSVTYVAGVLNSVKENAFDSCIRLENFVVRNNIYTGSQSRKNYQSVFNSSSTPFSNIASRPVDAAPLIVAIKATGTKPSGVEKCYNIIEIRTNGFVQTSGYYPFADSTYYFLTGDQNFFTEKVMNSELVEDLMAQVVGLEIK